MATVGPPQIFIDDSDPNIVYSGQDAWAVQKGVNTAPQPFIFPARAPFYGTQHQISGHGSLSYIYHGSNVSAVFNFSGDNSTFISSCIIDGKRVVSSNGGLLSAMSIGLDQFSCGSDELQDGEHNLTVIVQPADDVDTISRSPPFFDGLFYTPSSSIYTSKAQEFDLAHNVAQELSSGTLNMTSDADMPYSFAHPGDSLDFDFNGTALAIYGMYTNGNNVPVTLSYNVDSSPAMNFTLDNPSAMVSASNQLLLQTPQYAQGQHHLHLYFFGPASGAQRLYFSLLMVQNAPTTRQLALAPFPTIPGGNSNTSTSRHTIPRTIVAIAATLPVVLALLIFSVLYIKRRSLRLRFESSGRPGNGAEVTVTPFIPATFMRTIVHPSSKRMPDSFPDLARVAQNVSKANRVVPSSSNPTQAAALPPVLSTPLASVNLSGAVAIPAAVPASPAAENATEEPIYRIHEDGGSVHEASSNAARQRQVIDLPPLYNSNFGHRPEPTEDSNRGAD
ncbi:hypothetical protein CPC08DRAFT_710460 [Agrocybe pediades]|nr:hypothetical protein CPC08DRAFT_710460 [Agrocybe pediades]